MEKLNHTPGPWKVKEYQPDPQWDNLPHVWVEDGNGRLIADGFERTTEGAANARLIAAAPVLLTAADNAGALMANWRNALRNAVNDGRGIDKDTVSNLVYNLGLAIEELRAAVNKATER